MTDLTYASTDELLEELKTRHETMVYIGERLVDSDKHFYDYYKGSQAACIGLCVIVSDKLRADAQPTGDTQ